MGGTHSLGRLGKIKRNVLAETYDIGHTAVYLPSVPFSEIYICFLESPLLKLYFTRSENINFILVNEIFHKDICHVYQFNITQLVALRS